MQQYKTYIVYYVNWAKFELNDFDGEIEELYDLKNDPDQLKNVAADTAYIKILERMRIKLQERLTLLNDPRAKNPKYDEFDEYPYLGREK